MLLLTEDAALICQHRMGKVDLAPSQDWVRVDGRRLLVAEDPEQRPIAGCPNFGPGIKPCTHTLRVQTGYSDLVRIDGRRLCLDTVEGLTDGTPPGSVPYVVRTPGQQWISEAQP